MHGIIGALKYFFLGLSEEIKILTVSSTSFHSRMELYVPLCFSWQTVTFLIENNKII